MKNWRILKKDEKGKYEIKIFLLDNGIFIDDVDFTPKGKRKSVSIGSDLSNDYGWRALDTSGRREAFKDAILRVVPQHLSLEAVNEVWMELEPKELKFN